MNQDVFTERLNQISHQLSGSFTAEGWEEMKSNFESLTAEMKEAFEADPLKAVAVSAAVGFFLTRLARSQGSALPKIVGKGIGTLVATKVLEGISSKDPSDTGLRH